MSNQQTYFGSLENYQKGGVQIIDDNPKNYAFSNMFEVASKSKPYEKVAVGKNLKYVIEAMRAEGTSPWFAAAHDEAALVHGRRGRSALHQAGPARRRRRARRARSSWPREPKGKKMGWVKCRRGHMALLPAGRGLPVPQRRQAGRAPGADHPGRQHRREVGRDLPDQA